MGSSHRQLLRESCWHGNVDGNDELIALDRAFAHDDDVDWRFYRRGHVNGDDELEALDVVSVGR